MNGVVVSTRLPANIFAFSAGQFITITGAATLDLVVNVNGRKLQLFDSRPAPASNTGLREKKETYEITVGLAPQIIAGDEVVFSNSAHFWSVHLSSIGMISVLIYMLW